MIGIDCLCFVTPKGELNGSPCVGVTKIAKGAKGQYLLDHAVRAGAKVQVSALPIGWIYDAKNTDQGLLVRLFDATGRPNDHGFVLKIEAPKVTATLPVPEFSTSVRGELGQGEAPPASTTEPITATTTPPAETATEVIDVTTSAGDDDAGETRATSTDDDEAPVTRGGSSSSSSTSKRRR